MAFTALWTSICLPEVMLSTQVDCHQGCGIFFYKFSHNSTEVVYLSIVFAGVLATTSQICPGCPGGPNHDSTSSS
jgi:hypothetical protein